MAGSSPIVPDSAVLQPRDAFLEERAQLRLEIEELGQRKQVCEERLRQLEQSVTRLDFSEQSKARSIGFSPTEKVALFLKLFGARRDVYPVLWENAVTRKKGYSPAYDRRQRRGGTGRRFLPLDETVVEAHLRGEITIGSYALRTDDSCIFLSASEGRPLIPVGALARVDQELGWHA